MERFLGNKLYVLKKTNPIDVLISKPNYLLTLPDLKPVIVGIASVQWVGRHSGQLTVSG